MESADCAWEGAENASRHKRSQARAWAESNAVVSVTAAGAGMAPGTGAGARTAVAGLAASDGTARAERSQAPRPRILAAIIRIASIGQHLSTRGIPRSLSIGKRGVFFK